MELLTMPERMMCLRCRDMLLGCVVGMAAFHKILALSQNEELVTVLVSVLPVHCDFPL